MYKKWVQKNDLVCSTLVYMYRLIKNEKIKAYSKRGPFLSKLMNLSASLPFLLSPLHNHSLFSLSCSTAPSFKLRHACFHTLNFFTFSSSKKRGQFRFPPSDSSFPFLHAYNNTPHFLVPQY